jgi:hypothetical protein
MHGNCFLRGSDCKRSKCSEINSGCVLSGSGSSSCTAFVHFGCAAGYWTTIARSSLAHGEVVYVICLVLIGLVSGWLVGSLVWNQGPAHTWNAPGSRGCLRCIMWGSWDWAGSISGVHTSALSPAPAGGGCAIYPWGH